MPARRGSGPRAPRGRGRLRILGLLVLGLLVVVAAVLVWMAGTRPGVAPGSTAIPIPDYTPTSSATPLPPLEIGPRSRIIAPIGGDLAWRSSTLECREGDADAVIELSTDRGKNWEKFPLRQVDAAAILAIQPLSGSETVAVTSLRAADCEPGYEVSYTGAAFWRHEEGRTDAAYAVPGEGVLVAGSDRLDAPCKTPADLAVRNETEAAVVCQDAVLRTTADAGTTWRVPKLDASVVAVAVVDRGYLVAEVRQEDCGGIQLAVLRSGDGGVEPLACLAAFAETDPVALGVADDDTVWVWAGDRSALSEDGGRSWPDSWTRAPEPEATEQPTPAASGAPSATPGPSDTPTSSSTPVA